MASDVDELDALVVSGNGEVVDEMQTVMARLLVVTGGLGVDGVNGGGSLELSLAVVGFG